VNWASLVTLSRATTEKAVVIAASSSSVYGPDSPRPFTEDGPTDPCSPNALTKLIGTHGVRPSLTHPLGYHYRLGSLQP
jgi:nucleoside-diphosphate-sugar epimerase